MSQDIRELIDMHWRLANERRWNEFAELLAANLQYQVPQTHEYIEGREGYLDMFRTWPGDWKVIVRHLVCESNVAISIISFEVGSEQMTGISHFQVRAGRIEAVTDYWPEPYEPPVRISPWLKRQACGVRAA